MKDLNILFDLLAVSVLQVPLKENIKDLIDLETLKKIFFLSKKHDMAHLIGDALNKNGFLTQEDEISKKFLTERNMAIYRYEQLNYELGEICHLLEDSKIRHIPLKGSVIRNYYPEPWMRTSCDIDMLIQEQDLEKALEVLLQNGFRYEKKSLYDVELFSETGVHLELHYNLIENRSVPENNEVLENVWEYAKKTEDSQYTYAFTDEMFYYYHIYHMAKHFVSGGCGIKPFLDIYILNYKLTFDEEKRNDLLRKGKLDAFSTTAKKLSDVWFANAEHDELTMMMEEFILGGGVYGTIENKVVLQQSKKGGKGKYAKSRIFLPYDQLKHSYPVLQKHKWLTPIFEVVRWFRILFKGRAKSSLHELKTNVSVSECERKKMDVLIKELNL